MTRHRSVAAMVATVGIGIAGCVLAPSGTREERLRAERAGAAWATPRAERRLPVLGSHPTWRELLRHALLANGDLEAAFHEWRAALARIDVAAAYPNTNVSLDYAYMFSDENLKSWDRNAITLGFDPMQNLSFPTKPLAAGRVALADAQAAGERFLGTKLALQQNVLTAWYDFALAAEQLRLERENATLAALAGEVALARATAGEDQAMTLRSLADEVRTDDRARVLEAELVAARARLNALVGRAADAALAAPAHLPEPRPLAPDAALIAAGVRNNPELAALGRDVEARTKAVAAARQEFIPDLNPFVGIEGGMAQIAGVAVSLPARITMIRAQIREARAMEARALAREAQGQRDQAAEFLATLGLLRDAERRATVYRDRLVPLATQLVASARAAYEGGRLDLAMLLDAERGTIEAESMLAEAQIERERRLVALETLGGFDAETLEPTRQEERS